MATIFFISSLLCSICFCQHMFGYFGPNNCNACNRIVNSRRADTQMKHLPYSVANNDGFRFILQPKSDKCTSKNNWNLIFNSVLPQAKVSNYIQFLFLTFSIRSRQVIHVLPLKNATAIGLRKYITETLFAFFNSFRAFTVSVTSFLLIWCHKYYLNHALVGIPYWNKPVFLCV
jgi:hypothetical protein